MDATLIKALQLVLSLSILVVLHEGGHFFFSKLFRVKVEKFFLFFDPYFHLFSTKDKWFTRLFPKCKDNETEYGIGWLPFGGYVKIAGMIDESMDTEQMKKPVQPWEFRAKPAWQRLLIMIGGVVVNFLLALFIYTMILFHWGEQYIPAKDMTMGYQFNEQAEKLGFRDGDVLLAVDGEEIRKWDGSVYRAVSEAREVTVLREGREVSLTMPEDMNMLEMLKSNPPFMVPFIPSVIDSVLPSSPVYEAGIRSGDRIVAMDGKPVATWSDFDEIMRVRMEPLMAGSPSHEDSVRLSRLSVVYQSKDGARTDTVTLELGADYKLGLLKLTLSAYYKPIKVDYSGRYLPWDRCTLRICKRLEVLIYGRRCEKCGQFHHYREHFPCYVGLADVLGDYSLPEPDAGFHEHPAHSGVGWRSRAVPHCRDDSSSSAQRQVPRTRPSGRYGLDHGAYGAGLL